MWEVFGANIFQINLPTPVFPVYIYIYRQQFMELGDIIGLILDLSKKSGSTLL
jgi:hypothetical protein